MSGSTTLAKRLAAAADGDDLVHLVLLLLAPDRTEDIRREAADELGELLRANDAAAEYAEHLLLSHPLPGTADLEGAKRYCVNPPARAWLERLEKLQPAIEKTAQAWRAIPETAFLGDDERGRERADAVFVREGVWRTFVLSVAGECEVGSAVLRALNIPAVKALPTHRAILQSWRAGLVADPHKEALPRRLPHEPDYRDNTASGHDARKKRRPIDREKELARVERVKATIVEAMKSRDLRKVRTYIDGLVEEQIERSGDEYACMSLCSLAKEAQDLGMHSLQLELTTRAVELCPGDAWAWSQHGKALLDNGRLGEALTAHEQAVLFGDPGAGRAETLRSMGRLAEALESYDAVIREHPENVVAKNGRAETLRSMGRLAEALASYESVIREHPEDAFAKNGRACILVEQGHFQEALGLLDVESPSTQSDWISFHIKGMTLLKANRTAEALTVFETGLRLCAWTKQREYFASALAVARMRVGDLQGAKQSLETIDAEQERSAVTLVRIHVLGMLSEHTQARQTFDRLPETLRPIESELRDELGLRYVLGLTATRSDDWVFEREVACLLTAA